MSESDLYRKQRVAIENVASAISEMETAVLIEDETQIEGEPELQVVEPVVSHTEEL
jgi:hypothetical protein